LEEVEESDDERDEEDEEEEEDEDDDDDEGEAGFLLECFLLECFFGWSFFFSMEANRTELFLLSSGVSSSSGWVLVLLLSVVKSCAGRSSAETPGDYCYFGRLSPGSSSGWMKSARRPMTFSVLESAALQPALRRPRAW